MAKVVELEGEKFQYEGILNRDPSVLIDWFDDLGTYNPFCWLSNFYTGAPILWSGHEWLTAEHAYQAAKYDQTNPSQFKAILEAATPDEAKLLGRTGNKIRSNWHAVKFDVMKQVVWAKFSSDPNLGQLLLDTGDAYLQEGTFWNDEVWGVRLLDAEGLWIQEPFKRPGMNWLGTILMEVRSRLLVEMVNENAFDQQRFEDMIETMLEEEED